MRNKEETKKNLIDSVGRIIEKDGIAALGINSIAKESGADKVLIYRYFGGLDGLLTSFISGIDFFSNVRERFGDPSLINTKEELLAATKKLFAGQLKEMSSDKTLKEILLWEMSTKNEITSAIAEKREQEGVRFVKEIRKKFIFRDADIEGLLSVLSGAVYYLALRSATVDVYTGIDLKTEKGWVRIQKSIELIVDLIGERLSEKPKSA